MFRLTWWWLGSLHAPSTTVIGLPNRWVHFAPLQGSTSCEISLEHPLTLRRAKKRVYYLLSNYAYYLGLRRWGRARRVGGGGGDVGGTRAFDVDPEGRCFPEVHLAALFRARSVILEGLKSSEPCTIKLYNLLLTL